MIRIKILQEYLTKKVVIWRTSTAFGIFVLIGALSFASASDGDLRFGIRVGANMNKYIAEGFYFNFDMGYGFEAGLTAKYPLTNRLNLTSSVSFCYRVLGGYIDKGKEDYYIGEEDDNGMRYDDNNWIFADYVQNVSLNEMAVLVPIIVQFVPFGNVPIYLSAGMVLGFPFTDRLELSYKYTFEGEIIEEASYKNYVYLGNPTSRSLIDYGAAFGIGVMVAPNLGVDIKYVFNVNDVFSRGKSREDIRISLMYFTLGVSYFL